MPTEILALAQSLEFVEVNVTAQYRLRARTCSCDGLLTRL